MKKMRRFAGLLLAMVMVMSMAVSVFAAPANLTGHFYTAYQIFSGSQAEGDNTGKLGNVEWGDGIDKDNFLAALKNSTSFGSPNSFADCSTAEDVAEVVSTWGDTSNEAKAFAKLAYANKKGEGTACTNGATLLDAGYYLVVDVTEFAPDAENTVYNLALLQLTNKGDFVIANKTSVPEVQKKVIDTNDSTGETSNWQDSADYDIGDSVPFQLKATLADNVSTYSQYKIVFHDTMSKGLAFEEITKVTVDGKVVTSGYEVVSKGNADGTTTLTVTFDDVKPLGATDNSVVIVEYTAKLDTDAVIGSAGNPNEVYLEYSNNPNWIPTTPPEGQAPETPPTGETPKDVVIVFTYKVLVNKVTKNPVEGSEEYIELEGAGFTLYKKNKDGNYVAIGEELKGDAMTSFVWTGLDDGDYKLEETTTPAGYNTIAPIEFKITAEHKSVWTNFTNNDVLVSLNGEKVSGEVTFTGNEGEGSLTTQVVNNAGTTLPETGGMGTTIFYVIGATLAIGAAVVMVTRKRMSEN